ncbi:hypothetical protein KU854_00840 [Enterovibrio sp. NIFS-20-8]|nr:hypothetical protein [Enterovibrio paralichthyis]
MKNSSNKALQGLSYLFSHLPSAEKWLHFTTICWVLLQLLTSSGMHVKGDTTAAGLTWIDYTHMYGGLGLLMFATVFFVVVLSRRKVTDLYPWLSGNVGRIIEDIKVLLTFKLPEARPAGLAATIEGLGLLALLLAAVTGTLWMISFLSNNTSDPDFLAIHKTAVGAIEAYVWGHGLFALFHLLTWWRR